MGKVLVLGRDTRSFLTVVRSLGRAGLEVHVAWHEPDGIATRSRYIAKKHRLSPYAVEDDRWKKELIQLMHQERFDLVLAPGDSEVTALQQSRMQLSQHGRVYTISDQAFETLFDKFKTNQLARSVGVPVPPEVIVSDPRQAHSVALPFRYPILLKPAKSFNPKNPSARLQVRRASSDESYRRNVAEMLGAGPVAVQPYIGGTDVSVGLLAHGGTLVLAFQHECIHKPLGASGSSYRRSVPLSAELLDASLRLLRPLSYTGVAEVEFRVDRAAGAWFLMEVNARFWGWLPLALAAGTDFPLALYQLLVLGEVTVPRTYQIGVYCRNWEADARWFAENFRAGARNCASPIREALVNVARLREHSDTFVWDDPLPGLAELRDLVAWVLASLRWKLSPTWLQLPWMRRYRARRARKALREAATVLFVSKGNICRSAFAERLARRLGNKTVRSAGYYPTEGRETPAAAVEAAARLDVDLGSHSSRIVDDLLLREADVVFVFDSGDYRQLAETRAWLRKKLHFVGALNLFGPLIIENPHEDGRKLDEVYSRIQEALTAEADLFQRAG